MNTISHNENVGDSEHPVEVIESALTVSGTIICFLQCNGKLSTGTVLSDDAGNTWVIEQVSSIPQLPNITLEETIARGWFSYELKCTSQQSLRPEVQSILKVV